ncbi:MAG: GyrI-like domain-containing protein, partial [Lachnospiraceae bacterium]|nr:GyrI-like domain-containing protein [Lachnospiraceae bacterium]
MISWWLRPLLSMSYKGSRSIDGYFAYVVPSLESLCWQHGNDGIDYSRKDTFEWISMIRLPEFVMEEVFRWAVWEASEKKNEDFSKEEFFRYSEGLCVQCMHIGAYDEEPGTIEKMNQYLTENGLENDYSGERFHHEIYLSDPR